MNFVQTYITLPRFYHAAANSVKQARSRYMALAKSFLPFFARKYLEDAELWSAVARHSFGSPICCSNIDRD
jgi:hypothetical protein